MATVPLSDQDLARFGVELDDEGVHAFDPDVEWWNESWFWDWYGADAEVAGHCRVGMHPNQGRLWIWFFLKQGDEWVGVEEPRLPLASFDRDRLAYDGWGLRFFWEVVSPIRQGRLRFDGFGRVLSGPRTGQMRAVSADLAVEAAGPPHAPDRMVAGHASPKYPASRFEQPVCYRGTTAIGGAERPFEGRGERDHSWGPRPWNMEWTFLVMNGVALRTQCAVVQIPDLPPIQTGYLYRDAFESLVEVELDVEVEGRPVLDPVAGQCRLVTASAQVLRGEIESLSGVEIDITHVLTPPQRSLYRRGLVRVCLDGEPEPLTGWLEFNRLRGPRG